MGGGAGSEIRETGTMVHEQGQEQQDAGAGAGADADVGSGVNKHGKVAV